MTAHRILLVHGQQRRFESVPGLLAGLVDETEIREHLASVPDDGRYDLWLVDYDALAPEERARLGEYFSQPRRTRLLLVSRGECRKDYVDLFGRRILTNLIACDAEIDPRELRVTVEKLLASEIFGLERYLGADARYHTERLSRSSQKEETVRKAEAFAQSAGVHPRLINLYCSVADEFITNAIYNAPVNAQGQSRYRSVARTVEVQLQEGEEVEVRFACDDRMLAISAADPFGSLSPERLLEYLSRCFRKGEDQVEEKAGGAGLGFYYVFESLSQLVVNIQPGVRTEMIGVLDRRGRFRDFATRSKSFNLFVQDGRRAPGGFGRPPNPL